MVFGRLLCMAASWGLRSGDKPDDEADSLAKITAATERASKTRVVSSPNPTALAHLGAGGAVSLMNFSSVLR